jgi:hypothetical protein
MGESEFVNQPPSWDDDTSSKYLYTDPNFSWKYQVVQVQLVLDKLNIPQEFRDTIDAFLNTILTMSGMTNITNGQIRELLKKWDLIMLKLKIFNPDFKADISEMSSMFRFILEIKLNAAKDGWQGNHYFETHIKQEVKQQQETTVQKVGRFFGRNKRKITEEREI